MACVKDCKTCKRRWSYSSWSGITEPCPGYEMAEDTVESARDCERYVFDDGDDKDEEYTPSATAGDYSPNCPWNAPGMSVRDFI